MLQYGTDPRFQSTLSMRRATTARNLHCNAPLFQSTLSMRRATWHPAVARLRMPISIHALHEESDSRLRRKRRRRGISIHALHEESDPTNAPAWPSPRPFQSTLSMRRATIGASSVSDSSRFQSTLSMRRATFHDAITSGANTFQSTLSMRRATPDLTKLVNDTVFQSTLSMRRATIADRHELVH